ncbi:MAG: NAD-dependent epimerase/dehydratase family protein [Bacilli bacterium]
MKCLVTGGTGHIGNVLIRELFAQGYQIKAIVMPNDCYQIIEPYAEIIIGNILDLPFLQATIKDVDVVFHLAGIVEIGSGKKKLIHKVNVQGTKNIVDVCLENHIPRLVYTSSVHALQELPKPQVQRESDIFDPKLVHGLYAKSKAEATAYVLSKKHLGMDIIVVHPSGVIGPYDYKVSNVSQLFIDLLCGRLRAYLRGGYNFVDVRDVARGVRLAAEKGESGECYLLSGHEITVKQLLDEIAHLGNVKKVKTKLAYWFILGMSYFAELYYLIIRQKPLFTHYSIVVLDSNYHFSNEKAKTKLGFTTRDLKESIRDAFLFATTTYLEKHKNGYRQKLVKKINIKA